MKSQHRYHVDRLTTLVGPVVPLVLFGVSGMQLLSAVAYRFGLTPTPSRRVAAVLALSALIVAALAAGIRHAASRERVNLVGAYCTAATIVMCSAFCIAAYLNDLGVAIALPYCVLVAVGSTFFWLRFLHFVLGQLGSLVPPTVLLLVTSPSAVEWSFSIQIAGATVLSSTGMYVLIRRTSLRTYMLAAELEHRATYDGLTGVLNRASWLRRAEKRLSADQTQGRETSCLFIDLDRFKQVNDTFGHDVGDGLLGRVAEVLNQFVTADGLVGRMGGDEFVMLLPATSEQDADQVAASIVASMRSVQHHAGEPMVSIGVASSSSADTIAQLLQRADMAMLIAKQHNRRSSAAQDMPAGMRIALDRV